jgi:3-oxoadipate enol-lactonase
VLTAFRDAYINAHDEVVEAEAARRRELRARMTTEQVDGLIGQYLAFSTYDPWTRLGEIRTPTLVTVGADDAVTPVEYARDLHARIAGSTLHVIPDAPHRALTFAAEAFNRVSLEFLRKHRG